MRCARFGSGLVHNVITSKGSRYDYFTCLGRLDRSSNCDLPYLPADKVEAAVENLWRRDRLSTTAIDMLSSNLLKC